MNEAIFVFHISVILFFLLLSFRIGKEALVAFSILTAILANLFVLKQITLFSLSVTPSDMYAVGSILSLALIQEYFGLKEAEKTLFFSFFFLLFFLVMALFHILYFPSPYDTTQKSYETILLPAPRIILASLTAFYLSQKLSVILYNFLKKKMLFFSFRILLTLLISQCFDTIVFSFLGLFGLVHSVLPIIWVSFFVKSLTIFATTCFFSLSKKWITYDAF